MAVTNVVSATSGAIVLTFEYDPTGLEWVRIYDNPCLAWGIDIADISHPEPVIIGSLATPAPDTDPVLSPQWANLDQSGAIMVPNKWRGSVASFYDWIAKNNGAKRKVGMLCAASRMRDKWQVWKDNNPTLVLEDIPF